MLGNATVTVAVNGLLVWAVVPSALLALATAGVAASESGERSDWRIATNASVE